MEGAGDRDKLNICESRPDSSIHTLSRSLSLSLVGHRHVLH